MRPELKHTPLYRIRAISYPPGVALDDEEVAKLNPGDFILTHRHDLWAACIRFGERLRLSKEKRQYAYWNHCAMIVNEKGTLIEALPKGITVSKIDKYADQEFTVVKMLGAHNIDREHAVKFAYWAIGEGYGYLTFINVILWALVGGKLSFGLDGQMICSGLVARCMERFGEVFPKEPRNMMPSDLAMHFNVPIPAEKVERRGDYFVP